ncbi:hypothetical protein ACFXO9_14965 [Nocardia tengchongensis]|uniref:hypothetical protein n=1 Tax=Nocardia tengchongensis TaxID=2055889 RepID=UPI00369016D4
MTETVDLYVIARLESDAAVADILCCEVFYDAEDGAVTGRSVGGWWESVATAPGRPATLEALDEELYLGGYIRAGAWRQRVTAAGATRYFADATADLDDLDR